MLAGLIFAAAPAVAKVAEAEGGLKVGLRPRSIEEPTTVADGFANAENGPVVSSSKVYAVYWDPDDLYHGDWQELINGFFANMSESSGALANVFAVDAQYTDPANAHAGTHTSFEGAYTDTDPYPAVGEQCVDPKPLADGQAVACLTDNDIRTELQRFIGDHGLPRGMSAIYYVLTPPGVTDCLESGSALQCSDYSGTAEPANGSYARSFCSYHSDINAGGPEGGPETILYAAIPWSAGGLGDFHLASENRTPAYECQDGGFEPPAKIEEGEKREATPIEEEPNQIGLGPDGGFDTGLADLIVGQIADEQQAIVTDPLLNAWQGAAKEEVDDVCRNDFLPTLGGSASAAEGTEAGTLANDEVGGGSYYLTDAFNLAATALTYPGIPCLTGVSLVPSFTAPANAAAGEIVGFDGMESDISLDAGTAYSSGKAGLTYPVYEWSFGDGSTVKGYAPGAPSKNSPETTPCEEPWLSPCAASAFHAYAHGGTYEVTLTVTDVGGHTASVTEPVVVSGPAAPSTGGKGGSSEALVSNPGTPAPEVKIGGSTTKGSGKSSTSGKTGKSGKSETPLTSPKLTALVLTTSPKLLTKGLKVSYSVNEQAAGRFEVLVAKTLATHLHLAGSAATDLPKGSKPQTVIAHALLVTTRSARRTIEISIPKTSAARLAKLHDVTLTLRVSARDASRSDPQVSILQTVAKLVG